MKNKGLIITLIVFLVIIIIALVAFLVLCLNGRWSIVGFGNFQSKSGDIILEQEYEGQTIENIEILSSAGDITFEESTNENVRVVAYGKNSSEIKVNLENNKLKIDYSELKSKGFLFNMYSRDIIIYVPSNYAKDIKIKNDYGDCKIIDLENATVNVEMDCGDIQLGKMKNITAKCDYGDIEIGTIMNKLSIESNCGSIKIDKLEIKENSNIKSDLGDVEIKEANDIYIDASVDLGDIKMNRDNNRHSDVTLKIEADCGDVKVGE